MPRKLLIQTRNNPYIKRMIATMQQIGIEAAPLDVPRKDILSVARRERGAVLGVWGGAWRRATEDLEPPSPNVFFLEHGYGLDHYNSIGFDARGQGRHCSLPYSCPTASPEALALYAEYKSKHYPPVRIPVDLLPSLPKPPFVLCVLQLEPDTTMVYDSPAWCRDRKGMVQALLKCLPPGLRFVVKTHPREVTPPTLPGSHAMTLFQEKVGPRNNQLNEYLLSNCECMVTVNSSMLIECLAHGKPVLTLGKGIFTGNGVTKEVEILDEITFNRPELHYQAETVEAFLAEVCCFRQIHNADAGNPEVVLRVMRRLGDVYQQMWGTELFPPIVAEATSG